jgi:NAD(P)-dependent dehydrogenase (short-subunit alcohol dehydrogenase family)
MNPRFVDKVALVAGGNSGIGLATAQGLAAEGARVVITGRNPETLESAAVAIGNGAHAVRADITDLSSHSEVVDAVRRRHGKIDVLFVNAGGGKSAPIEAVTEEDWDYTFAVNLKGMFFMIQAALPLMGSGGAIVLTSSLATSKTLPGLSVYSAAKSGVASLGRTLGAELIGRGIRVNVVSPGPIDTPLLGRTPGLSPQQVAQMKEHIGQSNPMKRWGSVEEAARLVLFLASDDASFITGIDVIVDGGAGRF